MSAIVSGDYTTFKHVKTRKVVVLEIEVSEERFQEVISKLGMPIGGESKPVAVALLNSETGVVSRSPVETKEQTEGEKLRTRAVLLCKSDSDFQFFASQGSKLSLNSYEWEEYCRTYICNFCGIKSRSELATNINAQAKFKELLEKYKDWQFQNQYTDNLERI